MAEIENGWVDGAQCDLPSYDEQRLATFETAVLTIIKAMQSYRRTPFCFCRAMR